jgi:CheY-like chemotaxis protein
MGGRVSVRSAPGEGATFSVHIALPIETADQEGSGAAAPALSAAGVRRDITGQAAAGDRVHAGAIGAPSPAREAPMPPRVVLVAEDNPTNRKVIVQQLTLLGLAAEVVPDGRQALARWRSGDFALLLTDLHMPDLDGYALTAAIRAEEDAQRRMPIVAVTANARFEEELRCRAAGMDGYVTKPITLQRLGAVLGQWLELRTAGPASPETLLAATVQSPLVDLSVIHGIVGDDPDVLAEILQVFRDSAVQSSREMHGFAAEMQVQAVADVAHRMKSGARSIGARRLADTCAEIEETKHFAQTAQLDALLRRFDSELAAVLAFIDERL